MHILFYSTSSNTFNGADTVTTNLPSYADALSDFVRRHPEHTFTVATQLPGMFLVDLQENEICPRSQNVEYKIIDFDDEKEIAASLASLKPDLAIAASFFVAPYDWLTAKDSLVAQYLEEAGIKTVCHNLDTAIDCFDKWRTHQLLEKLGVNCPKAVYVHHALFINGGNRSIIKSNVYKTATLRQIQKLHFPVVIKDTCGLSSYGMDVLESFEQVKDWLKSKKFTSDRIVEEFISGTQAGTEISVNKNTSDISIAPPMIFSVNKYGITSPKQSVKLGPVTDKSFKPDELNSMLKNLAQKADFNGIAQVDLVFDGTKWFVIEINPRLSGMTLSYCAMTQKTVFDRLYETAFTSDKNSKNCYVLNIKFPLLSQEELLQLKSLDFVYSVYQIENKAARQLREMGYCEVIITGQTKKDLEDNLNHIAGIFADKMEDIFYKNAITLLQLL